MAKTLDDLQTLLTANGYDCQRLLDVIVATTVTTAVYKNPAGQKALEMLVTIDQPNDCVAIEILKAFDLRATEHKEATLRCLMTASGRTPLVRPALEPEGDIKLRVDCARDADGARDGDVLNALKLLYRFADAWYPQVDAAMRKGKFDPSQVALLNLSRLAGDTAPAPAPSPTDDGETTGTPNLRSVVKAAAISTKPGAHPNRLRALLRFRRPPGDQGSGPCDQN
jgi:hypothetical protein